jgi:hypothetical protein
MAATADRFLREVERMHQLRRGIKEMTPVEAAATPGQSQRSTQLESLSARSPPKKISPWVLAV